MNANTKEKIRAIISLTASTALLLLTSLLLFLCPIGAQSAKEYLSSGPSESTFFIGLACLFLFLVCVVLTVIFDINFFVSKEIKFGHLRTGALINFISAAVVCIASIITNLKFYPFVFLIIAMVLFAAVSIFASSPKSPKTTSNPVTIDSLKKNITGTGQNFLSITLVCIALIALFVNSFMLVYMPLGADISKQGISIYPSIANIFENYNYFDLYYQIFSVFFVCLLIINCIFFLHLIVKFFIDTVSFLKSGKYFAIYNITLSIVLMFFSFVRTLVSKIFGQEIFFITYINVLIAYVLYTVFVAFAGRAKEEEKAKILKTEIKKTRRKNKLTELIFQGLMTAITFSMFFVRLYSLNINAPAGTVSMSETPYDIFKSLSSQSILGNIVAFLLIILSMMSAMFLIFTILNYIVDSDDYSTSAMQYSYMNLFFQFSYLTIGLFYVLMVPTFDSIFELAFGKTLEELFGSSITVSEYVKVSTLAYIPFLIGFVVLIYMHLFCTKNKKSPVTESDNIKGQNISNTVAQTSDTANLSTTFDPCPAFSDLDSKIDFYKEELQRLRTQAFPNPTLQSITHFIVNFAANTPERLSYTHDTVATFIAGLGASRLSILQGMSGTGKTSLPKAFMQAIGGNCEIVEVESSWRDKNELLGYYNEFNGIYTPKKFTQFLYKAALNPEIPTFIVLDEMNLSRIEYYFSDFLSLMESREDQRAITLLNRRIYPPNKESDTDKKQSSYLALTDGNTIKIPPNVWFIGTANRDESTFEISDKVYDRAQTMNFDKRAPKVMSERVDVPMRFLEYNKIKELFEAAKKIEFNAESDPRVLGVEKLLLPYKISFGNRILKQIEDFVKVYMACFDVSTVEKFRQTQHRAIENIMYSKVLRKLELKVVENKAQLIRGFENMHFNQCAQFIRQLEDN
ncbi:MAG TPA: AAA family ATPase [Clostridia bacterium]